MGRILPVLFNTDMVRALLDGRKEATRRAVKYKYDNTEMKMHTDKYGTRLIEIQKDVEGETYGKRSDGSTWHKILPYIEKKPPCKKGDVLYVRETWCSGYDGEAYFYLADKNTEREQTKLMNYDDCRWHPSIHMPREAARIWLKVTDVRAERLQDITDIGARKESVFCEADDSGAAYRAAFFRLWDAMVKKEDIPIYGYSANPWVWAIEFERCEKPGKIFSEAGKREK